MHHPGDISNTHARLSGGRLISIIVSHHRGRICRETRSPQRIVAKALTQMRAGGDNHSNHITEGILAIFLQQEGAEWPCCMMWTGSAYYARSDEIGPK
jgi:hypothetical protein